MKKITLLLTLLLFGGKSFSQVSGYTFLEGTSAYAPVTTGTNSTATGDDGTHNSIPIGFTFNYGGTNHTTFSITTNGWIRLGGTIPGSAWTNSATNFASTTFRPLIAPLWDDNNRNTGSISYVVTGAAPNQVLTVDYNNVNIGGGGATSGTNFASFQIKLYETTNVIEFHYGATMATAGTLTATVGLSDASGYHSVTPGATSTSSTTSANHAIGAVTNLQGKMYRFTPPSCSAPGGVTLSAITSTTATVSWSAAMPVPSSGYEYYYSAVNTPPSGSGTAEAGLSVNLSSLSPQTTYYVWVRSNCGGSLFSGWSGPVNFTTLCAPVMVYPSIEPFNSYLPSTCWMEADNGDLTAGPSTTGSSSWGVDGFANNGTTGAANFNIYQAAANDWIISPSYTIPASGYELKYDVAATQYSVANGVLTDVWESDDVVEVLVSTTGLTNWTVLKTYNNTSFPSEAGGIDIIDLDTYAGQTVRFAFRAVEGSSNGDADIDFSFDNFTVRLTPSCAEPTGISATNVLTTSADLIWGSVVGSVGYEYVLNNSSTAPSASGTSTSLTNYNATGLTPNTMYYYWIRTNCGSGQYSPWAYVSFTTSPVPPINDECSNAITLIPGGVFLDNDVVVNLNLATDSNPPAPGCASFIGGDVWYSVTVPASGSITIETNNNGNGNDDTGLAVYSGSDCSSLVLVECDDDDSADGSYSLVSLTGRTAGETLYVNTWQYLTTNSTIQFAISAYDASLSSDTFASDKFTFYPNPVKDKLNISYEYVINNFEIYNLVGQVVKSNTVEQSNFEIGTNDLPQGTYFVKLYSEGTSKTVKVIKE